MKTNFYPFSAIVGQQKVKKALILNLICPEIGGVLLAGEKGTAKSTIVRSISELMPEKEVINVPLNATEDRIIGTLDIEKTIKNGNVVFEDGLLKKCNRNILYVDEINLLSESITSLILDSSALGINYIEREGISFSHESKFILVGSMNPEEGHLKPQILDRFGFYVDVKGSIDVAERMEIMKRRIEYEENPKDFIFKYNDANEKILEKIQKAIKLVHKVSISDEIRTLIAKINLEAVTAGHRGDVSLALGSIANAAYDQRLEVTVDDVKEISEFVLQHRYRIPPEEVTEHRETEEENNEENNQESSEEEKEDNGESNNENRVENQEKLDPNEIDSEDVKDDFQEENYEIETKFVAKDILSSAVNKRVKVKGSGRRNKTVSCSKRGRYIKYKIPKGKISDLAFDATIRMAAPNQKNRDKGDLLIAIRKEDLREKVREKRVGNTILFLVDTSGSMGIEKRMSTAKGAIFSLLENAYQKRDTVGMMSFRNNDVDLILNPTRSIDLAFKKLQDIKIGGKTPLALGIRKSVDYVKSLKVKDKEMSPIIVIVSDGRGNVSFKNKNIMLELEDIATEVSKENIQFIVVDTETGFLKLELAKKISDKLDAMYFKLDELRDGELVEAIKSVTI